LLDDISKILKLKSVFEASKTEVCQASHSVFHCKSGNIVSKCQEYWLSVPSFNLSNGWMCHRPNNFSSELFVLDLNTWSECKLIQMLDLKLVKRYFNRQSDRSQGQGRCLCKKVAVTIIRTLILMHDSKINKIFFGTTTQIYKIKVCKRSSYSELKYLNSNF